MTQAKLRIQEVWELCLLCQTKGCVTKKESAAGAKELAGVRTDWLLDGDDTSVEAPEVLDGGLSGLEADLGVPRLGLEQHTAVGAHNGRSSMYLAESVQSQSDTARGVIPKTGSLIVTVWQVACLPVVVQPPARLWENT